MSWGALQYRRVMESVIPSPGIRCPLGRMRNAGAALQFCTTLVPAPLFNSRTSAGEQCSPLHLAPKSSSLVGADILRPKTIGLAAHLRADTICPYRIVRLTTTPPCRGELRSPAVRGNSLILAVIPTERSEWSVSPMVWHRPHKPAGQPGDTLHCAPLVPRSAPVGMTEEFGMLPHTVGERCLPLLR